MRRKIELSPEAVREIDRERGPLSRSKYVDKLLKTYQGVLFPHTPETDCPKSRQKPKQK